MDAEQREPVLHGGQASDGPAGRMGDIRPYALAPCDDVELAVLALAATVSALAACDTDDGREMQTPDSYAAFQLENTTPSTSTTVAPPPTEFVPATIVDVDVVDSSPSSTSSTTLDELPRHRPAWSSTRRVAAVDGRRGSAELQFAGPWDDGAAIPVEFTCDGADDAPLITWTAPPDGTAELAMSVIDPDADGFVHWLVVGLPAEAGSVGGGEPTRRRRRRGGQLVRRPRLGRPVPAARRRTAHLRSSRCTCSTKRSSSLPIRRRATCSPPSTRRRRSTATFTGTYERA